MAQGFLFFVIPLKLALNLFRSWRAQTCTLISACRSCNLYFHVTIVGHYSKYNPPLINLSDTHDLVMYVHCTDIHPLTITRLLHHCDFICRVVRSFLCAQYLGSQTPPAVKDKIKSLLYSWKVGLPTEGKIAEAYEMLKKEGMYIYSMCMYIYVSCV